MENQEIVETVEVEQQKETEKPKIYTEQSDPEIRGLYEKFTSGRLDIRPAFQRNEVWTDITSSLLIESALLDIPIPVIYLAEELNEKLSTIDGQQRLSAFFKFIRGKYALKGLEYHSELNGKHFKELDKTLQEKIKDTKIRTIVIKKESDADLKYQIFERLNTGTVALVEQEIRNCVFRGKYNDTLKQLANNKEYLFLLTQGSKKREEKMKKRLDHIEHVLRFAAFYHKKYDMNSLKKFLNNDMRIYSNDEIFTKKEADALRKAFKTALSINKSLFGINAFRKYDNGNIDNPNGAWKPAFNIILYELSMVSLARYNKNNLMQHLDEIRDEWIDFIGGDDFFKNIYNGHTANKERTEYRYNVWETRLHAIMKDSKKEPRTFSMKLKREMFKKDNTCAICGNEIIDIDDAAIDHIVQFQHGGKTEESNARLTHRYCNLARPRNEVVLEITEEEVLDVLALDDNELSAEFVKLQEQMDDEIQYRV